MAYRFVTHVIVDAPIKADVWSLGMYEILEDTDTAYFKGRSASALSTLGFGSCKLYGATGATS
jgi:hypothetical protein